jgi:hypothetical protein
MMFWLGTHEPSWLRRTDVPLMVSHRRLRRLRSLPRAQGPWVLDSGGFSELDAFGGWRTSEGDYLAAVRRYAEQIGGLMWAAPQDWMCEPEQLARTGPNDRGSTSGGTVASVTFIPVLQGYGQADYLRCADMYEAAGIDLTAEPVVGLGSVCRRQRGREIEDLALAFQWEGVRLHGFGVKTQGLRYADLLHSADSMAWSYAGRRQPPMDGCAHGRRGVSPCNNCLRWALRWRADLLATTPRTPHLRCPWPAA